MLLFTICNANLIDPLFFLYERRYLKHWFMLILFFFYMYFIYVAYSLELGSMWKDFDRLHVNTVILNSCRCSESWCDDWVFVITPVSWLKKSCSSEIGCSYFVLPSYSLCSKNYLYSFFTATDLTFQKPTANEWCMFHIVYDLCLQIHLLSCDYQVGGIEAPPGLGGCLCTLKQFFLLLCRSWGWKQRVKFPRDIA